MNLADLPYRKAKSVYRTGTDDLSRDFFSTCLKDSIEYHRISGFFSSSVLLSWTSSIYRLIESSNIHTRLIASPKLSEVDAAAFEKICDPDFRKRLLNKALEEILEDIENLLAGHGSSALRANLLAWLIATGKIVVKFAFPTNAEDGMLHEKTGVITYPNGDQIAFTGSANETLSGHSLNYESIDVFRSWIAEEKPRIESKKNQFWEAWQNKVKGLNVIDVNPEVIQRIISHAPLKDPIESLFLETKPSLWKHQKSAIKAFFVENHGVLEMATGTGKTRTAIEIILTLLQRNLINQAVVTTEGNDLLEQWVDTLLRIVKLQKLSIPVYQDYDCYHQLFDFLHEEGKALLVVSRYSLKKYSTQLSCTNLSKSLLVDDEIHGLGAPDNREQLGEIYVKFRYRLGLSATPERAYDSEGNAFIKKNIGDTIFLYDLKQAISDGVLCEFDYFPQNYQLTYNDRQRLQAVFKKKALLRNLGTPMPPEKVWMELSRVYKTAEMKPEVFNRILEKDLSVIENCIIFVETKDYGEKVMNILHKYTHLYKSYFSGEDSHHLLKFSKKEIATLVTCHRLSQGIDFPALQTIVLFASSKSKLETIQRIGRALRVNPNDSTKRARIFDFCLEEDNDSQTIDSERVEWLMAISKTRCIKQEGDQ